MMRIKMGEENIVNRGLFSDISFDLRKWMVFDLLDGKSRNGRNE